MYWDLTRMDRRICSFFNNLHQIILCLVNELLKITTKNIYHCLSEHLSARSSR